MNEERVDRDLFVIHFVLAFIIIYSFAIWLSIQNSFVVCK